MLRVRFYSLVALVLTALFAGVVNARPNTLDNPSADTVITNRAEGTYRNEEGESFSTASETVTIAVAAVATVAVTPDDAAPSGTVSPHDQVTRVFRVCNPGNIADTFAVTRVEVTAPATLDAAYFDADGDGVVGDGDTRVVLDETASPRLQPGGCVGVLASLKTNDAPAQSTITVSLAARSNAERAANGRGRDTGTIINTVGAGPRITDPDNPSLPPASLVNGKPEAVLATGATLTISVAFKNSGDAAVRNLVLTEEVPEGFEIVPGTLQVEARSPVADGAQPGDARRMVVRLPRVEPGEVVRLSFRLRIVGNFPGGAVVVSEPVIKGDNLASVKSVGARVILNPFGVVFAGRAGSSAPVSGAQIELLPESDGGSPVRLPASSGFAPNDKNENPFTTNGQGHYSFALASGEGTEDRPATYYLRVKAQGYLPRMIQLGLRPTQPGVFTLTAHALDGQPLAGAAGFELVREDVRIENVAALGLNVPVFEASGLQITKSVDRARAEVGDTVTYQVEVHNPTGAVINNVLVNDRLPASFHYAAGSARVSHGATAQQAIEPETKTGEMVFQLGEIPRGATARLLYRVRVGANAREGEHENLASASGVFPSGEKTGAGPARALVTISAGVFSTRQVVIGRVFADADGNGRFDENDQPMQGIRLYLTNGESVVTDSAGLYNFPSLGDGAQVIALDPITVPPGYALADGGRESGKGWSRLLRTPIGGGTMLRQNFALVRTAEAQTAKNPLAQEGATVAGNKPEKATGVGAKTPARPSKAPADTAAPVQAPGTYEMAAAEGVEPVAAGEVRILSPAPDAVPMSPGLEVVARVALNWNVRLEVNGVVVPETNIGVRSLDRKNQVSTFTFVGLGLRPGLNSIRCTAVGPDGAVGRVQEIAVMGRGPARRVQLVPEKSEIQAGGNDSTTITVKAFDQWNNPALDGQVAIESSLGRIVRAGESAAQDASASQSAAATGGQPNQPPAPLVLQLVNGEAKARLVGTGTQGAARVRAQAGEVQAEENVHITAEMRPALLVGFAEMSFGNSIPEVSLRNEQGNYRGRTSFFFSGRVYGNSQLTLSYDSQRPINRTAGNDRLFQLDPLDRVYPLFGDSSTRFEAAPSNSKVYARLDHKRSYAMFGDFETDMDAPLAANTRKLTGVKVHLENAQGDFVTVTGARPDTAFARDVFAAGGLGIIQLSHAEILPGSETVTLEVRDRRNPEVIISQETLARSVDYNLDAANGTLFLLRYISTFDRALNLSQIVVTYEHRASGFSSSVYTLRAKKNFKGFGLTLGASAALQREANAPDFFLGGFDAEKTLPGGGNLQFAWATSRGQVAGFGNSTEGGDARHDGNAFQATLTQPLPFYNATLRARYQKASPGFLNPFGGTVTPGSQRGDVAIELKPHENSTVKLGVTSERNQTANVDNERLTLSAGLDQTVGERVKLHFGFDHRVFTDDLADKKTVSNMITVGAEIQATDKLQFMVKREQNLGEADPTYPTQTTLGATYQVNERAKLFFTQRLASAPIVPIADFTGNGYAGSAARNETAFGVETRLGKYTAMTSRYQLENGINGTDSFAVVGLQNSLPVNKKLSFEFGFERGFHLHGPNKSFNSGTAGVAWQPIPNFRASARYEHRDRDGDTRLLTVAAAGQIREGVTALARFQMSRGSYAGKSNEATDGMAALAIRPLKSDRSGLLFSYRHRSVTQDAAGNSPTRDRVDSLSADGYRQVTNRLELYGHFAMRLSANGRPELPFVSTLSYLAQGRVQYQLSRQFDAAYETRLLFQPSSRTSRMTHAAEVGYWVLPELRLGGGYNFTAAKEPFGADASSARRGFYFSVTTKFSKLFDLFGKSHSKESNVAAPTEEVTP